MARTRKSKSSRAKVTQSVESIKAIPKGTTEFTDGFKPFEGEYEKQFYDVRLPSGEIVKNCYPNAGFMNETGGAGRKWGEGEVEYRVSESQSWDDTVAAKDNETRKIEEEAKANAEWSPEDEEDPVAETETAPAPSFRFGRFPDWKFAGWQFIFYFGSLADKDMPHILLLGWKTVLLGIFKVKELPPE